MTSFTLSYSYVDSDDVSDYVDVRDETGLVAVFDGNTAYNLPTDNEFVAPFVARSVLLHPKSWRYRVAMEWSLMGCVYGTSSEISVFCVSTDYHKRV